MAEKLCWLVTCGKTGWRYLLMAASAQRAMDASGFAYGSYVRHVPGWTVEEPVLLDPLPRKRSKVK